MSPTQQGALHAWIAELMWSDMLLDAAWVHMHMIQRLLRGPAGQQAATSNLTLPCKLVNGCRSIRLRTLCSYWWWPGQLKSDADMSSRNWYQDLPTTLAGLERIWGLRGISAPPKGFLSNDRPGKSVEVALLCIHSRA